MKGYKHQRAAAALCLAGGALLAGGASPASAELQQPFGVITLDPSTAIPEGKTITLYAQALAPNTEYKYVQCVTTGSGFCDSDTDTFLTDSSGNATVQVTPERVIEGYAPKTGEPFSQDCAVAPRTCGIYAFNLSDWAVDSYGATLTFAPK